MEAEHLLIDTAIAWRKSVKAMAWNEGILEREFWHTVDKVIAEQDKKRKAEERGSVSHDADWREKEIEKIKRQLYSLIDRLDSLRLTTN